MIDQTVFNNKKAAYYTPVSYKHLLIIYLASDLHDTIRTIPVINSRSQTKTGSRKLIS